MPAFGENGDLVPPYNIRTPTRYNHDLTLFKNFAIKGDQKIQFRVGFFNLFNQAFANTNIGERHQPDARHGLQRARSTDVPNGTGDFTTTSATRPKGFDFTPADEGQLRQDQPKRGHRVIEFVLKYYF